MRLTTNCYACKNRRDVPGNCHIRCVDPDPEMRGNPHGIRNGWFFYPALFDPVWREKECKNFSPLNEDENSPQT